jgi:4-amino-4-deoxy-L-arabinose transferase-like glycosyltransferase
MRSRRWLWVVLALFLIAWAFLFAFHRYNLWDMVEGWVISDEGHQLYQPLRWMSGQVFYRDFTTDNYPPGMIVLHATLYRLFGVRMSVIRLLLTLVGAGIATLCYVLARKIMPIGPALLAYLLSLTWNVTNLNIGFPSWYCVLLGLAAVWCALRYDRSGRLVWLGLAGGLTALSAAFKVTQGAYQWLGLGLFLAWRSMAGRPRSLWTWQSGFAILSSLFGLALLRSFPTAMNLILFGLPLVALSAAVIVRRIWPADADEERRFLPALLALAGGAGIVTLLWAVPTVMTAGLGSVVEGVFLAPLRHSDFMRAVVQPPTLNGWLLLVWVAAGMILLWRSRRISPWLALGYGLLGLALLGAPLGGSLSAREALRSAFQTWRGMRFFLLLIAGVALVVMRRRPAAQRAPLFLLLAYGSWNLLQIYPFADSNHLIWSVQPGFILLAYGIAEGWKALRERLGDGRVGKMAAAWAAGALPAALVVLQLYPFAGHFFAVETGFRRVPYELLDAARADVLVRADAARTLRETSAAIVSRTTAQDTIFDTSGSFFYFATGRHNATRHDFIWPGFLTEEEIAGLIRDLETRRPALVIWRETDEHVVGRASFRALFPQISAAIERDYAPAQRIGEYALWARKP